MGKWIMFYILQFSESYSLHDLHISCILNWRTSVWFVMGFIWWISYYSFSHGSTRKLQITSTKFQENYNIQITNKFKYLNSGYYIFQLYLLGFCILNLCIVCNLYISCSCVLCSLLRNMNCNLYFVIFCSIA